MVPKFMNTYQIFNYYNILVQTKYLGDSTGVIINTMKSTKPLAPCLKFQILPKMFTQDHLKEHLNQNIIFFVVFNIFCECETLTFELKGMLNLVSKQQICFKKLKKSQFVYNFRFFANFETKCRQLCTLSILCCIRLSLLYSSECPKMSKSAKNY